MYEQLTKKENEILKLLADGLNDKQISEKLIIAPCTVRTHKNHIYQKLGVSGSTRRIQAVNIYIRFKSENRCAFKCLDNSLCNEGESYKKIAKEYKTCLLKIENVVNWLIDTLPENCENLKEYYDSILKMIQEVK